VTDPENTLWIVFLPQFSAAERATASGGGALMSKFTARLKISLQPDPASAKHGICTVRVFVSRFLLHSTAVTSTTPSAVKEHAKEMEQIMHTYKSGISNLPNSRSAWNHIGNQSLMLTLQKLVI
jgi:hypothetical protein